MTLNGGEPLGLLKGSMRSLMSVGVVAPLGIGFYFDARRGE